MRKASRCCAIFPIGVRSACRNAMGCAVFPRILHRARRGCVIALQSGTPRLTREGDMFDLVRGNVRHIPSHSGIPLLVSSAMEAAAITLAIAVPLLFVANHVPEVPSI